MGNEFADIAVEQVKMLALDTKNKVIGVFDVASGTLNVSMIHGYAKCLATNQEDFNGWTVNLVNKTGASEQQA